MAADDPAVLHLHDPVDHTDEVVHPMLGDDHCRPGLPDITREFSTGLEDVQWVINAYVLLFGAILSTHVDRLTWAPAPVREAAAAGRIDVLREALPAPRVYEATEAFMSGLDTILVTGAVICMVCGIICLFAVRQKDRYDAAAAAASVVAGA